MLTEAARHAPDVRNTGLTLMSRPGERPGQVLTISIRRGYLLRLHRRICGVRVP
jgi:hypothetical protein